MNSRKHITRMTPKMKVPGPGVPWRRMGIVLVIIVTLSVVGWTARFYRTHAMPNVMIAGAPVGLKTHEELRRITERRADELRVAIAADSRKETPALTDIGVQVDTAATVKAAFNARRTGDMPDGLALWQTRHIPLVVRVDQERLDTYLQAAFPDLYRAPRQPTLAYNASVNQFDVVPGEAGAGFDVAAIIQTIEARTADPRPLTIRATKAPVPPSVSDTAAVQAQDEANQRLLLRLEFLYQDKLIYFPEPPEMAAWFEFGQNRDGTGLAIIYDRERIRAFLSDRVEPSLNRFFGPGSTNPGSSEAPLQITATDALVSDVVAALRAGRPLVKEVDAAPVGAAPDEP